MDTTKAIKTILNEVHWKTYVNDCFRFKFYNSEIRRYATAVRISREKVHEAKRQSDFGAVAMKKKLFKHTYCCLRACVLSVASERECIEWENLTC